MRCLSAFLGILLSMGFVAKAEMLMPTTYSTSFVEGTELQCAADKILPLIQEDGKKILELCRKDRKACMMEGACIVRTFEGLVGINWIRYDENRDQAIFAAFDMSVCSFGLGMPNVCLDPYFGVAADLTEYKIGDVLFIEKIKGLKLPTGETHDGYVIVRDSSPYLKGAGAESVQFFTGYESDKDPKNAFLAVELNDSDKLVKSVRVTDSVKIKEVRKNRNFPKIPDHIFSQSQK